MAKNRLKLHQLRRILSSFGVHEETTRGKGGHTLFWKDFPDGRFSYPVPTRNDVLPCYVKGARRKFRLTPEDGIADNDFYSRA